MRLKALAAELWNALGPLFGRRRAVFYPIAGRRQTHPGAFRADMATLFDLPRGGAIHPAVIDRLPLAAAAAHARIDAGGLGGKILPLPWDLTSPPSTG